MATRLLMVYRGAWTTGTDYGVGAVVTSAGDLYVNKLGLHSTTVPASDSSHWTLLDVNPVVTGMPRLYGPYTVSYTDVPLSGNKHTLWTPVAGDVLLRLYSAGGTPLDHGTLDIGIDGAGTFATGSDGTDVAYNGLYVFGATTPVKVELSNAGDSPAAGGGAWSFYAEFVHPVAP